MKLILLHGENNYDSELKLNSYIDSLSKTFSKIVKVDGGNAKNMNDLNLDFDISLFGEKKAVVIKRIFQNSTKTILESFLKYLESKENDEGDNTIILWEDKNADKRTVLYKYILKKFKVEEFPKLTYRDLNNWVIKYGQSKNMIIGNDESYMLTLRVGENTSVIANEIDKLASLKIERLTKEDINKYLSESAEHSIFELLETILDLIEISSLENSNTEFHSKYSKMLKLSEKLFEDYKNYPSLIANLTSNLSTLVQIKILKEKGLEQSEIASQIPMHPFVFKKLYSRSNNFSRKLLETKFEQLADLDYKFKKGEIDASSVIVMIVK
ncbi:MAG: DNA polymerase III subunit delta [bacterium]